jgi:hypothetical protein
VPRMSRRLIPFALVGTLGVTSLLAAGYAVTHSPRIVYMAAPTLGTAAQARALDSIVRHSMQASSFTRTTNLETLVYQAPNSTRDLLAFTNHPSQHLATITIGSTEYVLPQVAGQPDCWIKTPAPTQDQTTGRTYALSDLMQLLRYSTALGQGDRFVVEKVVPATLLSVTPPEGTLTISSQKASKEQAVRERAELSFLRRSKGLLETKITVTVRRDFVVAVRIDEHGTFVTPNNQVVSRHLGSEDSYGHFNSTPPVAPPPAIDVWTQTATGTSRTTGAGTASCVGTTYEPPPVKGTTPAIQNQYLTLSQPLSAANVNFATAVVPHYKTTSNVEAKRLGLPLVEALSIANTALSDDPWPAGAKTNIASLIRTRSRMIAYINDLPSQGDVTSGWLKRLYDDGQTVDNLDDMVRQDLGLPSLEASST